MKKVNFPKLFLATLVILMFVVVGISIALSNIWLVLLFTILGFAIMGYGIATRDQSDS